MIRRGLEPPATVAPFTLTLRFPLPPRSRNFLNDIAECGDYPKTTSMNSSHPQIKGIVIAISALLLFVGGILGYYTLFSQSAEDFDSDDLAESSITPNPDSVPENQPLPPAPKEEVLKKKQQVVIGRKELRNYDRNKDGVVSREEYRDAWSRQFDNLDKNKDGQLHLKEWRKKHKNAFRQMDLNKSKAVERSEWLRFRDWCFDTFMDADKDGVATPGKEWNPK